MKENHFPFFQAFIRYHVTFELSLQFLIILYPVDSSYHFINNELWQPHNNADVSLSYYY